jgi:hypothetical protein
MTAFGPSIIVVMHDINRDKRRAFHHYARENNITLAVIERDKLDRPTSFQAWGSPQTLRRLTLHKYVRNWYYCSNIQPLGANIAQGQTKKSGSHSSDRHS